MGSAAGKLIKAIEKDDRRLDRSNASAEISKSYGLRGAVVES